MQLRRLAHDERAEFADLLATLTPQQWNAPTLCTAWRVRDVVAHVLSYDELTGPGLVARLVRGGFWLNRTNAVGVARTRTSTPEELLALLRAHLWPRGLTSAFGGRIALLDGMVHQQDVRRPLGLPRQIPEERLVPALRFALVAPVLLGPWRVRGLRLVATDLDFRAGAGPEVRGTGEALLMGVAGRRVAVAELTGPGAAVLAGRVGG